MFWALLQRDCMVLLHRGQSVLLTWAFMMLAVTLFPFAIGPDQTALAKLAPGTLWVLALFLGLLHLEKLYGQDVEDGSLEQLAAQAIPLWWLGFTRALSHWLIAFAPLIVISPVLLIILGVAEADLLRPALSLIIGTPALSFIGSWGAALTIGAKQASLVVTLVVFPLMIPTLIFGASAAAPSFGSHEALLLCAAVSLVSSVICPLATQLSLRTALD